MFGPPSIMASPVFEIYAHAWVSRPSRAREGSSLRALPARSGQDDHASGVDSEGAGKCLRVVGIQKNFVCPPRFGSEGG